MPGAKTRYAYGVEFTTPELIAVSGRTAACVRTWIRDTHGDMERVCAKCGFMDADQLVDALSAVRYVPPMDEETEAAVEEICEILGIVDEDRSEDIEMTEEEEAEMMKELDADTRKEVAAYMPAEEKTEAQATVVSDEADKRMCLLLSYKKAVDAVRELSGMLRAVHGDDGDGFPDHMDMLAGLIEGRCAADYAQYIRITDWDGLCERVRASCSD